MLVSCVTKIVIGLMFTEVMVEGKVVKEAGQHYLVDASVFLENEYGKDQLKGNYTKLLIPKQNCSKIK